jgi:hypothetical protein
MELCSHGLRSLTEKEREANAQKNKPRIKNNGIPGPLFVLVTLVLDHDDCFDVSGRFFFNKPLPASGIREI